MAKKMGEDQMSESMPPKQEAPDSAKQGWTYDTLNTHLSSMIAAEMRRIEVQFVERDKAIAAALVSAEKAVAAAMAATQKAIDKADAADNKRFDAANEFRGQLADQAQTFMPRLESMALHRRAQEDISELKERAWAAQGASLGSHESRARSTSTTNIVIAVVGVAISILVVVLNLWTTRG